MTPRERAESVGYGMTDYQKQKVERAIAEAEEAARVEERAACAAICDGDMRRTGKSYGIWNAARSTCAAAIRARGCTDDRCAIHGSGTMSEGSRCPTGDAARRATRRKEGRDG